MYDLSIHRRVYNIMHSYNLRLFFLFYQMFVCLHGIKIVRTPTLYRIYLFFYFYVIGIQKPFLSSKESTGIILSVLLISSFSISHHVYVHGYRCRFGRRIKTSHRRFDELERVRYRRHV